MFTDIIHSIILMASFGIISKWNHLLAHDL